MSACIAHCFDRQLQIHLATLEEMSSTAAVSLAVCRLCVTCPNVNQKKKRESGAYRKIPHKRLLLMANIKLWKRKFIIEGNCVTKWALFKSTIKAIIIMMMTLVPTTN